ncbi:hypothetical protein E2L06_19855 [Haloterrigena sp. H1]|nr:hypothetical protein E2L06_19855 [Haloterrigena sp. H1]
MKSTALQRFNRADSSKGRDSCAGEYLTVCYELHHVLFPELVDMRIVEFDRFEDEVRRGLRFDEVHRFLE